jgi:hypothetical protein
VDRQIPPLRSRYSVDRSSLELVSCVVRIALPGFAACVSIMYEEEVRFYSLQWHGSQKWPDGCYGRACTSRLACVMFVLWLSRSYRKAEVLSPQVRVRELEARDAWLFIGTEASIFLRQRNHIPTWSQGQKSPQRQILYPIA